MPVIWINSIGATAPVYISTAATTIPTASAWRIYQATTTSTAPPTVWTNAAGTATMTSTGPTAGWYYIEQEEWVEHSQYLALAFGRAQAASVRSEEQRLALERAKVDATERALRRAQAFARSRQLLLEHLTAAQLETFERHQWFVVVGGKSKTSYRIRTDRYAGNIDVLDGDRVSQRLCVHCSADIPLHDHHLAQKLSLQYDEEYILSIANRQAA